MTLRERVIKALDDLIGLIEWEYGDRPGDPPGTSTEDYRALREEIAEGAEF